MPLPLPLLLSGGRNIKKKKKKKKKVKPNKLKTPPRTRTHRHERIGQSEARPGWARLGNARQGRARFLLPGLGFPGLACPPNGGEQPHSLAIPIPRGSASSPDSLAAAGCGASRSAFPQKLYITDEHGKDEQKTHLDIYVPCIDNAGACSASCWAGREEIGHDSDRDHKAWLASGGYSIDTVCSPICGTFRHTAQTRAPRQAREALAQNLEAQPSQHRLA